MAKDVLTIDDLAKLLDLPDFDSVDMGNSDYVAQAGYSAYRDAIEEGVSSLMKRLSVRQTKLRKRR